MSAHPSGKSLLEYTGRTSGCGYGSGGVISFGCEYGAVTRFFSGCPPARRFPVCYCPIQIYCPLRIVSTEEIGVSSGILTSNLLELSNCPVLVVLLDRKLVIICLLLELPLPEYFRHLVMCLMVASIGQIIACKLQESLISGSAKVPVPEAVPADHILHHRY